MSIWPVCYCHAVSVDKDTFVQIVSSPESSVMEDLIAVSMVEEFEESFSLLHVFFIVDGEDFSLLQETVMVEEIQEFFVNVVL